MPTWLDLHLGSSGNPQQSNPVSTVHWTGSDPIYWPCCLSVCLESSCRSQGGWTAFENPKMPSWHTKRPGLVHQPAIVEATANGCLFQEGSKQQFCRAAQSPGFLNSETCNWVLGNKICNSLNKQWLFSMAATHYGLRHTIFCHPQLWAIPHGLYSTSKCTKTGGTKCARRYHSIGLRVGPYKSITL